MIKIERAIVELVIILVITLLMLMGMGHER
jgi:hypothetical protein